jgi:hypothetical protein
MLAVRLRGTDTLDNIRRFTLTAAAILSALCPDASGIGAGDKAFNYDGYASVLKQYVDDTGMVDYKGLKAKPHQFQAFLAGMGKLNRKSFEKWTQQEKIAFWLNAYNAFTLKVLVDNYPIKSSFFRSRVWPKNSIRQIPGVWNKLKFKVMGKNYTLEHIEHKILRKEFDEPRIHVAMVCAAMGCPPLRNEPYLGGKLVKQLDDQIRRFLADPKKFKINREKNLLHLSPIFNWFSTDFVKKYAPKDKLGKHDKKASSVLNFVAAYLPDDERAYLLGGKFKIKHLKYDWSLNEQPKKQQKRKK